MSSLEDRAATYWRGLTQGQRRTWGALILVAAVALFALSGGVYSTTSSGGRLYVVNRFTGDAQVCVNVCFELNTNNPRR